MYKSPMHKPSLSHVCKPTGVDQINKLRPTGYAQNINFLIIISYN